MERVKPKGNKHSEELFHRMVEEVQDYAIFLMDKEGIIQNWNKGAEKIKGYKAEEIIGKHFSIFYRKEDQEKNLPKNIISEAAKNGRAIYEGWRVRKNGSVFWGNIVITALHNEKGDVVGYSKVTHDLTQRKILMDMLQDKNSALEHSNQELASFAYIASHDLQEPLRKMQAFSHRLLETETANLTDTGKDYFNRLIGAAKRMQQLIDDLLSYSRATTNEKVFVKTDINVLVEEVKAEMKEAMEEKNIVIKSGLLPTIEIIPFQFKQLLTNLFSNSLKFNEMNTPSINIKYELIAGNEINEEGLGKSISYHHIGVSDNGIGFDNQYNKRIFDIFLRLNGRAEYTGSGVGLAICKKIVDNHHGKIFAEGRPGEGATFNIYLPAK